MKVEVWGQDGVRRWCLSTLCGADGTGERLKQGRYMVAFQWQGPRVVVYRTNVGWGETEGEIQTDYPVL